MTLPPPPIWPNRSAEEYRRAKSGPSLLIALGLLVLAGLIFVGVAYYMRGDSLMFSISIIAIVGLVLAFWYASHRERQREA